MPLFPSTGSPSKTLRCRICELLASVLNNPYQYSGQVIAKLGVNLGTMVWSLVVLWKDDALDKWPWPDSALLLLNEDLFALIMFVLASMASLRLIFKSAPIKLGACVYGVFLLLWLYTFTTLVIAIYSGATALRPGQLAGVIVITSLAVYAFVSNPKRAGNEHYCD